MGQVLRMIINVTWRCLLTLLLNKQVMTCFISSRLNCGQLWFGVPQMYGIKDYITRIRFAIALITRLYITLFI